MTHYLKDKTFGERIKFLRERRCWTQAQLAKEVNYSRQMIAMIETNHSSFSLEKVNLFCSALLTTPNDLFAWEEEH